MFVPESKFACTGKELKKSSIFEKINFFLQRSHNGKNIKNSKKNFCKSDFLMELNSKG